MVSEMLKNSNDDSQVFKCKLYNIPYREKITLNLSPVSWNYFHWTKYNNKEIPNFNWKMKPKLFLEKYFDENKQYN